MEYFFYVLEVGGLSLVLLKINKFLAEKYLLDYFFYYYLDADTVFFLIWMKLQIMPLRHIVDRSII